MTDLYRNFVGGKWVESVSGDTFERRNPATGEVIGTFTNSDHRDVDTAVAAAKAAFGSWRLFPAPKRGEILFKAARLLEERKEALAREMTEDQVLPAHPDNEYGWEKLYAERMAQAYARHTGTEVRVARFQNCYGPYGTWRGGREKAPAAISRKVAMHWNKHLPPSCSNI